MQGSAEKMGLVAHTIEELEAPGGYSTLRVGVVDASKVLVVCSKDLIQLAQYPQPGGTRQC